VAFDTVVVGGGTAGCVVAARVAELGSGSVALLEAGPDVRGDPPGDLRNGFRLERGLPDWGFISDADGEPVRRGRLLGGTSWLTRFALRGQPADYDLWAAHSSPGWGFEEMLPWLRQLEADADFGSKPWHGDSGPMPVRRYLDAEFTDVLAAAARALEQIGFQPVDDHNRPGAVGVGRMPMTSSKGARVTTADAYLRSATTSANLMVRCNSQVADVLFDGLRAAGVRLVDGTLVEAGHVVLCAGVYGSPAILMRSGIGPPDDLRALAIDVGVELPGVGENLIDHPSTYVDVGTLAESRATPLLHAVATFHSTARSLDQAPDLLLWIADPEGDPPLFAIEAVLLVPEHTRGRVRLGSADPSAPPRITLPTLTQGPDADRLAEAVTHAVEIGACPEVQQLLDEALPLPASGELHELMHANHYSIPHVVGTCAMGSVVDAQCRVRGTEALSVVDASAIPVALSAFTQLPTIALAERFAALFTGRL
jgi:choline dehydrogenase